MNFALFIFLRHKNLHCQAFFFCCFACFSSFNSLAFALDHVEFKQNGALRQASGRILIEAQDGLVLETRDMQRHIIATQDLAKRSSDDKPFTVLSKKELLEVLKKEFPESQGYNILQKEHFLIVYTTSKAFADWYGQLLEKLYTNYINFWKSREIVLDKLEIPLVVLIYANRPQFFRHARSEGVSPNEQLHAYYNKLTNRVVLCDISGIETFRQGDERRGNSRAVQTFLEQPGAVYNIAMVVHEATHQIGFNCGMHQRNAPYPLWLCEGLALFHEVPDRGKRAGWSIRPKVNDMRLRDLKRYLQRRPQRPLQTLIEADEVLREPTTALDNYAMAWGLTYYLVMQRPKEFSSYLNNMAEKTFLSEDSPAIRIRDFEDCFGKDWEKLYKECGEYLQKLDSKTR